MEAAYSKLLEFEVMATPPININTPKKVKLLVASEIQKLRESGSSDSVIEHLLDTDGLTKMATPTSKEQETGARLKKQEAIFTATPPPIKQVLQTDSSKMAKLQKQLKRTVEAGKFSEERILIKENKETRSTDKKTTKPVDNKFQEKIKIRNAKELIQKFTTKEDLNNGYLKEYFKNNEPAIFEINKNQNYIIIAPSNVHCFNKMKAWSEDIIKKDQLEVFEKDIRSILCVNKIPENTEIETVKNIILNCGLHPENIHRL